MGKIKKLTELAKIELGLKPPTEEESARFIDLDTDTSSMDSRTDTSSSDGDYYLDYKSVASKDKPTMTVNTTSSQTQQLNNQTVQFDAQNESLSFYGGPFAANELIASQSSENNVGGQEVKKSENKSFYIRAKERITLYKCFLLFKCAVCIQ